MQNSNLTAAAGEFIIIINFVLVGGGGGGWREKEASSPSPAIVLYWWLLRFYSSCLTPGAFWVSQDKRLWKIPRWWRQSAQNSGITSDWQSLLARCLKTSTVNSRLMLSTTLTQTKIMLIIQEVEWSSQSEVMTEFGQIDVISMEFLGLNHWRFSWGTQEAPNVRWLYSQANASLTWSCLSKSTLGSSLIVISSDSPSTTGCISSSLDNISDYRLEGRGWVVADFTTSRAMSAVVAVCTTFYFIWFFHTVYVWKLYAFY